MSADNLDSTRIWGHGIFPLPRTRRITTLLAFLLLAEPVDGRLAPELRLPFGFAAGVAGFVALPLLPAFFTVKECLDDA